MVNPLLTKDVAAVIADVGEQAALLDVAGWLQLLGHSAKSGDRLSTAAKERMTAAGANAASEGIALPIAVDAWLTAGWVMWRSIDADVAAKELAHRAGVMMRVLDDGAKALAEGFVRAQQSAIRRDEGARATLVDWLLGDAPPERVLEAAGRAGVDIAGRRSVLAVGEVSEPLLARFRDAGALVAPRMGTTVAVITGRVPRGPETAGLGRPGVGVAGIRASYGEALRALDVAQRLGLRGVVPYADVLPEALIGLDRVTLRELVDTTLEPLRSTRNGGPQYVQTVETWLQVGLSVAATARALGVHERTIRYRLARIAKLTGMDLQHADDRFRLDLAIRGERLLVGSLAPSKISSNRA